MTIGEDDAAIAEPRVRQARHVAPRTQPHVTRSGMRVESAQVLKGAVKVLVSKFVEKMRCADEKHFAFDLKAALTGCV